MIAFALALLLAQEDLDAAIKDLASKMSKEGISGKLAEAAASEWGAQAIREKIDVLLAGRTARLERDPLGFYEDHLFATDENGDLSLRPERKIEMERLAGRISRAGETMRDFNRRCDGLVKRMAGEGPLDRAAKEAWSDPAFRVAFFHRHPAELREFGLDEHMGSLFLDGLERGADGKLRLSASSATDFMTGTLGTLDQFKPCEKPYLQQAAKVKDEAARATLTSDAGILFVLGRLLRQAQEGGAEAIGGITDGDPPSLSFNLPLEELAPLVKEAERVSAALQARFAMLIPDIEPTREQELALVDFLSNGRVRMLLAERAMALMGAQRRKADEILAAVVEDGFEEKDGRLRVKAGRYVDDQKAESLDALHAELSGVIEEFNGTMRQDLDRIAERCLDASVAAMFEDRAGTFLLLEHRDRTVAGLIDAVRRQAIDAFQKAYLVKEGEVYVVRPDRIKRVDAILERAAAIKKEMEK